MKSITSFAVLLILFCAYSVPAEAQGGHLTLVCNDCRNPRNHPRDYRNFAYNQVFAPDAQLNYDEGDFFQVVNPQGESVYVDLNMRIGVITVDLGLVIPLPIATVVQVQVILIFENGDQRNFMIDPRAHPNGLHVGERRPRDRRRDRNPGGPSGPPAQSIPQTRTCGITRVDGGPGRRTCIWV